MGREVVRETIIASSRVNLVALSRRIVWGRLMVLQTVVSSVHTVHVPLSLRLRHLLLERCTVQRLKKLERTQEVLRHGHDRSKVVKLSAVAIVSIVFSQ